MDGLFLCNGFYVQECIPYRCINHGIVNVGTLTSYRFYTLWARRFQVQDLYYVMATHAFGGYVLVLCAGILGLSVVTIQVQTSWFRDLNG